MTHVNDRLARYDKGGHYHHPGCELHRGDAMSQQRPEQSPQSRWLEELIGLIRLLCPPEKDSDEVTVEQVPAKRRGRVTPDDERGPGWFSVPLAGQVFESDQLEPAYLAPRQGGRTQR